MNRIIILIIALITNIILYSQDYGKYSLPHTTDNNVLKEYVGKRVKVLHADTDNNKAWNNSYYFESEYRGTLLEKEYTIASIKANKKEIKIDLLDNIGKKSRIEVNAQGNGNFQMNSCNSFFLVDDFKKDNESIIGQQIKDANGVEVATIIDIDMYGMLGDKPHILYTIEMVSNGQKYLCSPNIADTLFSKIGTTLSHSKVNHSYLITGISANILKSEDHLLSEKNYFMTYGGTYISKSKENLPEIYNGYGTEYIIINTATNEQSTCRVDNPIESAFEDDLKGHYVLVLNSVEKPSNSEIRYGETSVVTDDNITKYSYIDNYIDIVILGTDKQFTFILKNVSDNTIKVIWDEAVFVDYDGSTSKIMHKGIKYSQREEAQPATTIIKGAKIEDLIIPTSKVYYYYNEIFDNSQLNNLNGWTSKSLYPEEKALSPGQLKIMLPIQVKDVVNEYILNFDVKYIYDRPEIVVFSED